MKLHIWIDFQSVIKQCVICFLNTTMKQNKYDCLFAVKPFKLNGEIKNVRFVVVLLFFSYI